jgi:hypothetical protein
METFTVLLIGIASILGGVALGVGAFVLDPDHRHAAAWHPHAVSPQHQRAGARVGLRQH